MDNGGPITDLLQYIHIQAAGGSNQAMQTELALLEIIGGFRCMRLTTLLQSSTCDVKFSQIEGNGRKCCHLELSNIVISLIF